MTISAGGYEKSPSRDRKDSLGRLETEFYQTCPDTAVAEDATLTLSWCRTTAERWWPSRYVGGGQRRRLWPSITMTIHYPSNIIMSRRGGRRAPFAEP